MIVQQIPFSIYLILNSILFLLPPWGDAPLWPSFIILSWEKTWSSCILIYILDFSLFIYLSIYPFYSFIFGLILLFTNLCYIFLGGGCQNTISKKWLWACKDYNLQNLGLSMTNNFKLIIPATAPYTKLALPENVRRNRHPTNGYFLLFTFIKKHHPTREGCVICRAC